MFFKEEFIDSLKADPILGTDKMVDLVGEVVSAAPEWDAHQYEILIEAYALVMEMLYADILSFKSLRIAPNLSGAASDCPKYGHTCKMSRRRAGWKRRTLKSLPYDHAFEQRWETALFMNFRKVT